MIWPAPVKAMVCSVPAAIATTLETLNGTFVCPRSLRPHAMTLPSENDAVLSQGEAMPRTGRDCDDTGHIGWDRGFSVIIVTPTSHAAIMVQREAVLIASR